MATTYTFTNVVNNGNTNFNQLLGINNNGTIVGYFGSGVPGQPNQGYTTTLSSIIAGTPSFTPENFPGSVQTQVTGINGRGNTVGFYSPTNNGSDANFGFYNKTPGSYTAVVNPLTTSKPAVNQLLGINNSGIAAGFYNDVNGISHGYTYDTLTGVFTPVVDPSAGVISLTATAINNADEVAGFFTDSAGTHGFLDVGGKFTTLNDPGFTFNGLDTTQIFGLNNKGLLVGDAVGPKGLMFGVTFNDVTDKWQNVAAPGGLGTTTFNGVNDAGDIVGFYVNSVGNTIGLLATPTTPATAVGPSVVETGATAHSFDAWSLLAPDAGIHSSLHYENEGRGYASLSVAVASDGPHYY
jgi:hypothetical protein